VPPKNGAGPEPAAAESRTRKIVDTGKLDGQASSRKQNSQQVPIDSIEIGTRHRRDLGDLAGLAASHDGLLAILAANLRRATEPELIARLRAAIDRLAVRP
jgi:hypothetical protein